MNVPPRRGRRGCCPPVGSTRCGTATLQRRRASRLAELRAVYADCAANTRELHLAGPEPCAMRHAPTPQPDYCTVQYSTLTTARANTLYTLEKNTCLSSPLTKETRTLHSISPTVHFHLLYSILVATEPTSSICAPSSPRTTFMMPRHHLRSPHRSDHRKHSCDVGAPARTLGSLTPLPPSGVPPARRSSPSSPPSQQRLTSSTIQQFLPGGPEETPACIGSSS